MVMMVIVMAVAVAVACQCWWHFAGLIAYCIAYRVLFSNSTLLEMVHIYYIMANSPPPFLGVFMCL